jgi:cell division protein FtsI/penicillin-binding protein 2
VPLVGIAAAAFAVGVVSASGPDRAEHQLVTRYLTAWTHGDYARMYGLLDSASKQRLTEPEFASEYQSAAQTATMTRIQPGKLGSRQGDAVPVKVRVFTNIFGTFRATLRVPLSGTGSDARVHFSSEALFPGLQVGEQLSRNVVLAPRAELLARDGTPLAVGPSRTSPIPDVAGQIVGRLGPIPSDQAATYAMKGYPADAKVGLDGLERVFQSTLGGTPGGTLLAGSRVLAHSAPTAGPTVATTLDPRIERAAVTALAGRSGGIAVMDPRTGGILALAGFAFSALQPPGSTMKIITATGALEAGLVKLTDTFPIQSYSTLDGVKLQNANGEYCGGTFLNAFAVSCNSVFAPLGAKLGATKLVNIAERFGFNHKPSISGAGESQIPQASDIGDALAVGSSAIGQGKVLSSALGMTDVAATIAMGGRRPVPTLLLHQKPHFLPVTSRRIAKLVERMMVAVVSFGTGTSAAISGVKVAGKTGTAELRNTTTPSTDPNAPPPNSPLNTDAWFVGYAPVGAPRVVAGALFPMQGAGGATAAPAIHDVLAAALTYHH